MQVLGSYKRDQWKQEQAMGLAAQELTFETYCHLSEKVLNAPFQFYLNRETQNKILSKLLLEVVNVTIRENEVLLLSKKEQKQQMLREMEYQGRKLIDIIRYAWQNIVKLVRGKHEKRSDPSGMYTDTNIEQNLARLSQMLTELRNKNYRFQLYVQDYSYALNQEIKEMNEELVFIRLLKSIVTNRTQQIIEKRETQGVMSGERKGLRSPLQVVKVQQYFSRKGSEWLQGNSEDPIAEYERRVRFNAAVMRFGMGVQ